MNKNKKAFTLTELLVALGIIGAIAALSIPSLLNSINNKALSTQLRSFVGSVQQLANDQMVTHKTRKLEDTDFGEPLALVTTSNFDIAKDCSASDAKKECWKLSDDSSPKVEYRKLSDKSVVEMNSGVTSPRAVILKNGILFNYYGMNSSEDTYGTGDRVIGAFTVDLNGNDAPNIIGRDFFIFYITNRGRIVDSSSLPKETPTLATLKAGCQGGTAENCFGALAGNSWKMDY